MNSINKINPSRILSINILFIPVLLLLMIELASCKKNWLDKKPDSRLVVLETLEDYQQLMDNSMLYSTIALGEVGADNYFVPESFLAGTNLININQYLWAYNGYGTPVQGNWSSAYQNIFTCNTAINGLSKIIKDNNNKGQWDQVYGTALFYRAFQYYQLSQVFMKPYDSANADQDPGVPLRLEADITQTAGRGTVQDVYKQLLSDLILSKAYLPNAIQAYKTRPAKIAAFALLAQVYLSFGDVENAFANADSALKINSTLLDYNQLPLPAANASLGFTIQFPQNPEVFFYSAMSTGLLRNNIAAIDSNLFKSYATDDLRRTFYFNASNLSSVRFRGSYNGSSATALFSAIAIDELYLIRAECWARKGNLTAAMNDLNALLSKRWKTGTLVPFTAIDITDALTKILRERRKELVFRNSRWTDLRRLNKDSRFTKIITRLYNGQVYNLAPGSNLYAWPIPDDEIMYSGITQNPR